MNTSYKETLNLPKTRFAMKANLANKEPGMLKFWDDMGLYKKMLEQRKNSKKFILIDGPPYANGQIHLGHALNKILKDFIIKSKHFSGFQVPFVPGWDCHGLPIELQVEKKIGKPGSKVDAVTFREKCREYAKKQVDTQRKSFMRLGGVGDWLAPYQTMSFNFEADILRTFGKIVKNGHLQAGDKPVHWCTHCGSALAEAEVEYQDKTSASIYVLFQVVDTLALEQKLQLTETIDKPCFVAIWTTTPWTLPANEAVALHPELSYALVDMGERCIIVAEELVQSILSQLPENKSTPEILGKSSGRAFEHLLLNHPFYDKQVPVCLGEHVSLDAGTGCVHTAPAHGLDDYFLGQQYQLPVDSIVNSQGCFVEDIPVVGGLHVFKANEVVINTLDSKGHLLLSSEINHSYPHCWRHKKPLIFRATKQWFISMEKSGLRQSALSAIKNIKWIPDWGQARIDTMISGRPDWCVSRQRTWGTPLPLFLHKTTGEPHPRTVELIEQVAERVEKQGIEAWFSLAAEELLGTETENYEKSTDTMDVWFDSGAVHVCNVKQNPNLQSEHGKFIADLYLEGSDQHRGWFQTSLLTAMAGEGTAPYCEVLTHGFTVDPKGHKMSKSLGNVITPEQVINQLGADVLRLWVASTDYRGELTVSDEIFKRTSDAYRRIRNTARFLLANLHDFDPAQDLLPTEKLLSLDRWVIEAARRLQAEILLGYENYQFHVVYQKIHRFCVDELGSIYLDIIKDRQYTGKTTGIPRRSAQTAIFYVINYFVHWIAPILSFTAEEIWQLIPGERSESVFLSEWFENNDLLNLLDNEPMNFDFWNDVLEIRIAVNKALENARAQGEIGSGLEADLVLYCDDSKLNLLQQLKDELRFVLITSSAQLQPIAQASADITDTEVNGLKIKVTNATALKCERCWHRRADVNENKDYPDICSRCIDNISSKGEQRQYA